MRQPKCVHQPRERVADARLARFVSEIPGQNSVLDDTRGLPYGLYVHGNLDTAGAITAVETIAGGLGWQRVAPPVEVRGQPDAAARAAVAELAATVAATVMPD